MESYRRNLSIRKAIRLVHYVLLLKKGVNEGREQTFNQRRTCANFYETIREKLSDWKRQSTKLTVSKSNREEFRCEMPILQDKHLEQEVKLMENVCLITNSNSLSQTSFLFSNKYPSRSMRLADDEIAYLSIS